MKTQEKCITVRAGDSAQFRNLTSLCVGTGRLDLALHGEYQRQLRAVQDMCHFRYIRGHGIFSDQMGICQVQMDGEGRRHTEYCFTYLDRVMDAYLGCGLRPFLELGFMPAALTDSQNTLFYWKAHTAPPREMDEWTALVRATLSHLARRYGEKEVSGWPCEIWNEPNLPGFWENADKKKYLELYRATVQAIKDVLPDMRVGGPAICGGTGSQEWIADFLAFCRDENVPVDFVTRHAYMAQTPERRGRYLYHRMSPVRDLIAEMRESRRIMDSFPEYRGMPMYITEFNTSYSPFCPIHDTDLNAVTCAALLGSLGDVADGYSYWTFGDVFEEQGIPSRPFHGGFGMMANGLIPKPTLWAFSFFSKLQGEPVYRDECAVLVRREDGGYEGVLWNLCEDGERKLEITLSVPMEAASALAERVDEKTCNPLRAWHEMGEPADLDPEQLAFLRAAGQPAAETLSAEVRDGIAVIRLELEKNALVHLRVLPVKRQRDEGYDYSYYCGED
ncbi:MAG: xylan 1,4-beta-xylosidase [Clostridia bacterium]|nr:xylan 1,4-beta-xylosidase [Clostridia bacterium]